MSTSAPTPTPPSPSPSPSPAATSRATPLPATTKAEPAATTPATRSPLSRMARLRAAREKKAAAVAAKAGAAAPEAPAPAPVPALALTAPSTLPAATQPPAAMSRMERLRAVKAKKAAAAAAAAAGATPPSPSSLTTTPFEEMVAVAQQRKSSVGEEPAESKSSSVEEEGTKLDGSGAGAGLKAKTNARLRIDRFFEGSGAAAALDHTHASAAIQSMFAPAAAGLPAGWELYMHQAYGLVSLRRARASGAKQSGYVRSHISFPKFARFAPCFSPRSPLAPHSPVYIFERSAFGHAVNVPATLRPATVPARSSPSSVSMTRAMMATTKSTSRELTALQRKASVLRAQLTEKRAAIGKYRAQLSSSHQIRY